MVRWVRDFRRSEDGASLTEALLVMPIMVLVMASFVEFAFAMFQWNQTVKAVQIGARQLAVSDSILGTTQQQALVSDLASIEEGRPVPATILSQTCGAGATACDAAGMDRLIFGSDGVCSSSVSGVSGMCDLFPRLNAANVTVTYSRAGLGYVGRPGGPVLSITVATSGLTFDFLFLGGLLGLDSLPIPPHSVTFTSEDMSSSQ
jgi:Flp pilus assembly protein TadG